MKLVDRLARQFEIAFNTLLSVTFHVAAPSCDVIGILLFSFDICICADQLREQFLFSNTTLLLTCAARGVQPRNTCSGNDTGLSPSTSSCNCPTSLECGEFFLPSSCRQHTLTQEQLLFAMQEKALPSGGLSPVLLQSELSHIFLSHESPANG